MRELFVYYRVLASDSVAAQTALQAMQARLRARHPGLLARLLHRPDAQDGVETWMETYAFPADHGGDGVDASLQATIEAEAAAHAALIAGPRHTEVFIACAW